MELVTSRWDLVKRLAFLAVVLLTAFVFAKSSFIHGANPYQFFRSIDAYRLLPESLSKIGAMLLPLVQLVLAIGLVVGKLRFYSVFSALLLAVFFLAQLSTVIRGIDLSCGCFSSAEGGSIGLTSLAIPGGLATGLGLLCFANWQTSELSAKSLISARNPSDYLSETAT